MISKLQNVETPGFDPIHKAVFVGDAARPVALPTVLERLGFADASERVPADILGQGVNSRQHSRVCLAPPSQVLLCLVGVERLTGDDGRGAAILAPARESRHLPHARERRRRLPHRTCGAVHALQVLPKPRTLTVSSEAHELMNA